MKIFMIALIVIPCLYAAPSHALGDLLMSAEQRAQIDIMRSKSSTPIEQKETSTKAMKIDGFFFKNHDKREQGVIWVNGKQVKGTELDAGIQLKKINERDKTVSVILKDANTSTPLKAGQKLMLNDGKIQDSYEP